MINTMRVPLGVTIRMITTNDCPLRSGGDEYDNDNHDRPTVLRPATAGVCRHNSADGDEKDKGARIVRGRTVPGPGPQGVD